MNEVYNLMDVYCHPFTSGGQEIPIQEAKLTELITLVTNYSCGEDSCEEGAGSFPLEWAEYREPDTMFIKASTYPNSISKQLLKVYSMKESARKEMGAKARKWVIENFSIEAIGAKLEEFIDNAAKVEDYSIFESVKTNPDPYFQMPEIKDDGEWILALYHKILDRKEVDKDDEGYKHWMARINRELPRDQIEQYFRQVAFKTVQEQQAGGVKFEDFLNKDDKGRVLIVMPEYEKEVYTITSIFKSVKERYPNHALYVSTQQQYKQIIDGNPYVDGWIPYSPIMDNILWLEGKSDHKGYFDVAYLPHVTTQRIWNYTHNGQDKKDYNTKHTVPFSGCRVN